MSQVGEQRDYEQSRCRVRSFWTFVCERERKRDFDEKAWEEIRWGQKLHAHKPKRTLMNTRTQHRREFKVCVTDQTESLTRNEAKNMAAEHQLQNGNILTPTLTQPDGVWHTDRCQQIRAGAIWMWWSDDRWNKNRSNDHQHQSSQSNDRKLMLWTGFKGKNWSKFQNLTAAYFVNSLIN